MKVLLGKIASFIINPIIILGFVIATVIFFYGIAKFIWSADSDADRKTGKDSIMYGVIGLFIMFSVYGILHLILDTFQIPYPGILP